MGWFSKGSSVKIVETGVTLIDGEIVLLLGVLVCPLRLVDVAGSLLETIEPIVADRVVTIGLELSDHFISDGKITPLENVRFCGLLLNCCVLDLEGLLSHLGNIGILHPVDREEISEATSDVLAIDLIVW